MDLHDVRFETDGPVAIVTLDRPRYRNAQSWRLLDELDRALVRAVDDRAVRAIVVRGAGGHFSAGHDLRTPEQLEEVRRRGTPAVGTDGRHGRGLRGARPEYEPG
jgi:enoyl-CoA hydratase